MKSADYAKPTNYKPTTRIGRGLFDRKRPVGRFTENVPLADKLSMKETGQQIGMRGCRPMTDTEVEACLDALKVGPEPKRDRAIFILGVRAGFRISELLAVKIEDVYQCEKIIDRLTVERRNMKKKNQSRTVALHSEAKVALKDWIQELKDRDIISGPLFRSRQGIAKAVSRKTMWRIFTDAHETAGLTGKIGTHGCRKTFAKRTHKKLGNDLLKTQKALGHSDIKSTMSYLSFNQEEIEDAILKD